MECKSFAPKSLQLLCCQDFDLYPLRAQDFADTFCKARASQGFSKGHGEGGTHLDPQNSQNGIAQERINSTQSENLFSCGLDERFSFVNLRALSGKSF